MMSLAKMAGCGYFMQEPLENPEGDSAKRGSLAINLGKFQPGSRSLSNKNRVVLNLKGGGIDW
jgi:hypothetical protein